MSGDRLTGLLLQLSALSNDVATFTEGMTRDDLDTDLKTERALGMSLLVIAELVGKIADASPAMLESHRDVPWAEIRGFRNFLAHDYLRVERGILWNTATVSVPALMRSLADVMPPHNRS